MAPRGQGRVAAFSQAAKCEISSQIYPDIQREITIESILLSVVAQASHSVNKAPNLCRKPDGIGCNKCDKWHGGY